MTKYALKSSRPVKALVYGETSTGKTTAVATLLLAGFKVRFLSADPNAAAGIQAGLDLHKLTPTTEQLGICIPAPSEINFDDLIGAVADMTKTSAEAYLKGADKYKKSEKYFINVLQGMKSFTDTESGTDYGSSKDFGKDTFLVVDSLTVLVKEIARFVHGNKPPSWPETLNCQGWLEQYIDTLRKLPCNVILLGHPRKHEDKITGQVRIYPATIGTAMDGTFSSNFTDVVVSMKENGKFYWTTLNNKYICSGRNVPEREKLDQDYRQFFDTVKE